MARVHSTATATARKGGAVRSFTALHTNAKGKTRIYTLHADTFVQAWAMAHKIKHNPETDELRIYPSLDTTEGVILAALWIAKKVTDRHITYSDGKDTLSQACLSLRRANIATAYITPEETNTAERLNAIISELTHDAQDLYGYAVTGLYTDITADIAERYKTAFSEVNRYVYSQRTASEREMSTEYIIENGGNIVSLTAWTGRLVNADERYTPTETDDLEQTQRSADIAEAIQSAYIHLTPRQKQIVKLLAHGYSERQIAAKLKIKQQTAHAHIVVIRQKMLDHLSENAPNIAERLDVNGIRQDYKVNNADRHAEKTDRHKDGQAAYMREYRKRRAEKAAILKAFQNKQ